jgi:tRNA-specific 2-thiouridylase
VAYVDDARRVAQQLGIDHHVFNFTADFDRHVVGPYVDAHAGGRTPNPCIDCNTHLKFDRFLQRALALGFDTIVTGHHARVTCSTGAGWALRRGRDALKDQSYVLYMLGQAQLSRLRLPVGEMTKDEVRQLAAGYGLRTADKPDSQDVCFISKQGGREAFLGGRIPLRAGRLVTPAGEQVGEVGALQLVTVGQRRGLGLPTPSRPDRRFVTAVDLEAGTATVGGLDELMVGRVPVTGARWALAAPAPGEALRAQFSAHGTPAPAVWAGPGAGDDGEVVVATPVRRPAPGQAVVLYRPDDGLGEAVVGGATVTR